MLWMAHKYGILTKQEAPLVKMFVEEEDVDELYDETVRVTNEFLIAIVRTGKNNVDCKWGGFVDV